MISAKDLCFLGCPAAPAPPTHAEVATDAGGKEGAEAEAVEGGRVGCTTELEQGTSAILSASLSTVYL